MSLTPNFGFNIPDSTDIVNLLTQCYPNFTIADTALQAIKQQGISQATESKSGTVHNIVRVDSDCSVFWFTATSNFTTGDTFTVDGSPVSAVKVSGAGLETGDFVINSNVPCIVKGSVLTVLAGGGSSAVIAQDVTYDNTGSGLTATNVQDAIDEVVADIPTGFSATAITYDNSGSGLTATNAQDAIDELVSNTGGDVYSTSEHAVGKWIDNSDVYEKTYTADVSLTGGSGTLALDAGLTTASAKLISADGYYTTSGVQKPIFDEFRSGSGNAFVPKLDSSNLYVSWSSPSTITNYIVTVRYIKIV